VVANKRKTTKMNKYWLFCVEYRIFQEFYRLITERMFDILSFFYLEFTQLGGSYRDLDMEK